jgi:diaminopimelate epimerase
VEEPEAAAVRISDRHFGIGSDGLILICPSETADFKMRMFNADGSEGAMCGNGIRCLGKYVRDRGLTDKDEITVETLSGIKSLRYYPDGDVTAAVRVVQGSPGLDAVRCPFSAAATGSWICRSPRGTTPCVHTCVSMGNPHAVTFVDDTVPVEY